MRRIFSSPKLASDEKKWADELNEEDEQDEDYDEVTPFWDILPSCFCMYS